jgi:hypothetical protein
MNASSIDTWWREAIHRGEPVVAELRYTGGHGPLSAR